MNRKTWIKRWFAITISLFLSAVAINFSIDPLWFFSFSNKCNTLQIGFDERLQKSIRLKYHENLDKIDTLLIGSSRTTYYDQTKFGRLNVFNYAFSNAYPIEYTPFINYAKKLKGKEFQNIILGLDFFGYGKLKKDTYTLDYLNNYEKEPYYIISNYITFDALKYSFTNIGRSLVHHTGGRSYDRNNVVLCDKKDVQKVRERSIRRSETYWANMIYDENYSAILKKLKSQNLQSNFIVFTTPLSKPFLQVIYKDKVLKEYYFHWIEEMVGVFGKIYFFTMPSILSENYQKYSKDGNHFYPSVVENISNIITEGKDIDNFGVVITKENLDQVLMELQKQVDSYSLSRS